MKTDAFTIKIAMIFYDLVMTNEPITIKRRWNDFLSHLHQKTLDL